MRITPLITKNVLFPVYKFFQDESFYPILDQLKESQWLPYDQLKLRQWQKLQALLDYAYQHVPYYRHLFQDLGLHPQDIKTAADFQKLPYLTKDIVTTHKNDLVVSDQKLYNSSTSGSTGEPFWFSYSLQEQLMRKALFFLGMSWAGLDIGQPYAKLWGNTMEDISRYQAWLDQLKMELSGYIFLSAYDLSKKTLPDYINRLKAHQPKLLESYP